MSEIDTINVHPADAKQWNNKSRKKRQSVVMETNAGEYVFARKTRKESAGKFALLRHGNKAAMWWRKRNGLMACSQWEERGIGSLRRRLQKDSRERGSGIFIIGIPVTVSKPFTALISVAELRWKRTREVKERKKEKEKNDLVDVSSLVLPLVVTDFGRETRTFFR